VVTSNFEAQLGDIVLTKEGMLKIMRRPITLTNIDQDPKADSDLAKRLAKAFDVLQDLEE
jgi:hypothetical protein